MGFAGSNGERQLHLAEDLPNSLERLHLDPDVALMLLVKEDDAAAFEQLVLRYQSRLVRLMLGWVNSQDVADELVQEVFLRVFRSRKSYEPTAKLTTWIYRIANNVASNAVGTAPSEKNIKYRRRKISLRIPHRLSASRILPSQIVASIRRGELTRWNAPPWYRRPCRHSGNANAPL